jgi:hypothetical protein
VQPRLVGLDHSGADSVKYFLIALARLDPVGSDEGVATDRLNPRTPQSGSPSIWPWGGIAPSTGTLGDAYDNGLMESVIGLFKDRSASAHRPSTPSPT